MARGYKAILEVKCWKEHTCCYCGVPFRYPLQKLRTGRGSSQQAAVNAAKNSAVHSLRDEQAMRPCPGCGNFQPEMIGGQRLSRHAVLFLITLVVFVSVFILGITDSIPASFAIIVLVICATLIFLANTIVGAANPNRNVRANKELAARLVEKKLLQTVPRENEAEERARPVVIETGGGYWLCFLLLAATLVLMPGGEFVRAMAGWHANPGWHPPIVGAGDSAWTWLHPDKAVESIRGCWKLKASSGRIQNWQELGFAEQKQAPSPTVRAKGTPWPDSARSNETPSPVALWAYVDFPRELIQVDRRGGDKRVKMELKLTVARLVADKESVQEKEEVVSCIAEVQLSSFRAGFLYGFFWCVAVIGGGLMFLLSSGYHMMRDYALKRSGLATRVIPMTEEEGSTPVGEENPKADEKKTAEENPKTEMQESPKSEREENPKSEYRNPKQIQNPK